MIATVHLVDRGVRSTLRSLGLAPQRDETPGLREARTVIAAPLGGRVPAPQFGRLGLVAFWEDDAAVDAFLAGDHQLVERLAGGWSARLDPLRAVSVADGHFPGVPTDLPDGPDDGRSDGPVVVLTIGHLRRRRTIPFLRASNRAERQVVGSPGLLWATGLANVGQSVVATLSLWASSGPPHAYATSTDGHTRAMREDRQRSFHHAGSFVRLRPYAVTGSLDGRNPLPDAVFEPAGLS